MNPLFYFSFFLNKVVLICKRVGRFLLKVISLGPKRNFTVLYGLKANNVYSLLDKKKTWTVAELLYNYYLLFCLGFFVSVKETLQV